MQALHDKRNHRSFGWNDILEECRGLVVDADYNTIVHPFTKIYNRGERGTDVDRDDMVTIVRKVNGFMAAVTVVNGEVVVSTTGSLDSDFVQYAKDKLGDLEQFKLQGRYTYIFEIAHEEDPHIIIVFNRFRDWFFGGIS